MKKILSSLFLLAFVASTMVVHAQSFVLSPEKVVPGETVNVTYNPTHTPLEGLEKIITNVFLFEDDKPQAMEIPMTYTQGKFTGSFAVPESAKAMLFSFTNEKADKQDNNDKKGYKTICYKADRKTPVQGAYASKAYIVGQFGWMADMDRDNKKAVKLLNKEFEKYPASAENMEYQSFYASAGNAAKDQAIVDAAKAKMQDIMKKKKATEDEMNYAYMVSARIIKDQESSDAIKASFLKAYPKSNFASNELSTKFRKAKDISEKIKLYDQYTKEFAHLESFKSAKNNMIGQVASAYSKAKDWDNFNKYFAMNTDNSRKAGMLNSIAWPMSGESLKAEAKDAAKGKKLSMESLQLLEAEMKSLSSKPDYFTERQYKKNLKNSYAMFADTYALLAYHNGEMEEALNFQQISCDNNEFSNGEMNQRYCAYYEKVNGAKATEKLLAEMIAEGKASSMMKEQHKRLYMANNTMESAYDKYVVELEKAALAKMRAEIEEQQLDMPAPDFKLLSLEGEEVSLESLKGKVVVVDFWATWCGPCKASFPGMQKAVNKFENSDDVAFVFIDTWESGKDVDKKVADFISSNNYSFNVLMDNENAVVANFGVSGIPTKFIVDKDGIIRFKTVGFGGNDEELVNELSMMIEIAGGTIPTPVTGAP